ncbi:MAG TPA: ATP-dependent helicase, partial [Acetobacteraceae bacterium]|nr:ATP-dependent helicase [Acetobacteraceae bacterium]
MTAPARCFSSLTPQQAAAAVKPGAVLVLAGAGTGKTRTLTAAITDRIGRRGIAANRILSVTFTNKAAAEIRDRVGAALDGAAPSWLGTFHGLAARQLREEPEIAGLRPGFDILDADDSRRLLKRTLKALNLSDTDDGAGNGRDPLKLMCQRLARFKDDLVAPGEAPARTEAMIAEARRSGLPIDPEGFRRCALLYGEYQRRLREANAADFGDLLLWPVVVMQADAGYRRRWADRFGCVLADEFQDVNLAQFTWLRLLAADHGEIFVVGDDDQSVYGWRGADVGYIRRFTCDFPGAAVFRLEENFRSTGHILGAANAVI